MTPATATFLFTDIEGSTQLLNSHRAEYAEILADHHRLLREQFAAYRGNEIGNQGDSFFVTFARARDAVLAAAGCQRALARHRWPAGAIVRVRMGIHTGEAQQEADRYVGMAIHRAARISAVGHGGQVLVSQTTAGLLEDDEDLPGISLKDLGEHRLKDISHPVRLYQLDVAGLPTAFPELAIGDSAAKPPRHGRRSSAVSAALAVLVVLVLLAIAIRALTSSDGRTAAIDPKTLARLDAKDGSVNAAFNLDVQPGAVAIGFDSAWVVEPERDRIVRVRLEDGSVSDTIPVGRSPSGIAVGGGAVWVTSAADGTVDRIDAESNTVSQTLPAGSSPVGIAFGDGALWVADRVGAALLRIDPVSGDSVAVEVDGLPSAVAFTPEGVWVTLAPDGLARVDRGRVTFDKNVGQGPSAVTYAFGSIWVANELDASVTRVEPSTGEIRAAVPVGEDPISLVGAGDRLWVSSAQAGSLAGIDPAADSVASTIPVEGETAYLAANGDDLWLGVGASAAQHRGGTLHVSAGGNELSTLDPPLLLADPIGWPILSMTNDGLVAYRKVGGPDGLTIVPDLASAMPEISDDGLTYRFAVRDDVTYSNGEPVQPEDFRRALERSIALSGDAGFYFAAIVGAAKCHEQVTSCDLSDGIEVSGDAVTFHLTVPDGDLMSKLAMPFAFAVPADTPIEDVGLHPVPATGPYEITDTTGESVELERNPRFREWSAAAQPSGFANAISIDLSQQDNSLDQLADGDIDVMLSSPDPEDLAVARAEYPARIFEANAAQIVFIALDVKKPPFDDERVRQALSFAVDRARLVDLLGGTENQRPTCQILPPTFQGYTPYCPFTRDPGSEWSGTDLDRARKLVAQAGATGEPVRVSIAKDYYPGAVEVTEQVAAALDEIGLRATTEVIPVDRYQQRSFAPPASPEHPQVLSYMWFSGYPGASEYLGQYRCDAGYNVTGYCDRAIDRRFGEAQSLQTSDPGSATRAWSEIEHDLVDDSALVPVLNPISTFVVSDRAGNVRINPGLGVLLGQIWVR